MTLLAAAAVVALAASPRADEGPSRREQARERVQRYFEEQVKENLGLSEEQHRRVVPLMRRMHENRRSLRMRRVRALQQLRETLASGTATERRVAEVMERVKALEREEAETFARDRSALDAQLTAVQQAKLRLLEAALERRIRSFRSRRDGDRRGRDRPRQSPEP